MRLRRRNRSIEKAALAVVLELRQSGSCRVKTREDLAQALGMDRKDRAYR